MDSDDDLTIGQLRQRERERAGEAKWGGGESAAPFLHPSEGSVTSPTTVFEQHAEKRYLAPPPSSLVAVTVIDCLRIHIHPHRDCIIDLRSRSTHELDLEPLQLPSAGLYIQAEWVRSFNTSNARIVDRTARAPSSIWRRDDHPCPMAMQHGARTARRAAGSVRQRLGVVRTYSLDLRSIDINRGCGHGWWSPCVQCESGGG